MDEFNVEINGIYIPVVVEKYYPGDAGKTYGPPETCYPPEPAEIDWFIDGQQKENKGKLVFTLAHALYDSFLNELDEEDLTSIVLEQYEYLLQQRAISYQEDLGDYLYESRRTA